MFTYHTVAAIAAIMHIKYPNVHISSLIPYLNRNNNKSVTKDKDIIKIGVVILIHRLLGFDFSFERDFLQI